MAITCPKCGKEFDVTLFQFGNAVPCDCGARVDISVGHLRETEGGMMENDDDQELFEILLETPAIRIERITSHGHVSPKDFWYDQERHEMVFLLRGSAALRFEDEHEVFTMEPGDFVNIPAHRRHRVEWTDPDQPTVWLAVHYTD